MMDLRSNRKPERAAVNATQAFFESNDFVFQEVDTGNDYGRDAYVDMTEGITVTGFFLALQIKGGASYRRPGGYGIPCDKHEAFWRAATAPVGGIVQDPDDGLLRWCNISEYLEQHPKDAGSYIPIPGDQILTPESLQTTFKESFKRFWDRQSGGKAILRLCTADKDEQMGALLDCFAYGRRDARVLIVLRYMLKSFRGIAMHHAIHILSHTTAHGEILWHKNNWISEDSCKEVAAHFRWTTEEILLLFSVVPWPEWQRGGFGESLYMLFVKDPDIRMKMEKAAIAALDTATEEDDMLMYGAFYLTLYWAEENGKVKYYEMLARDSRFHDLSSIQEIESAFESSDRVLLFEIA